MGRSGSPALAPPYRRRPLNRDFTRLFLRDPGGLLNGFRAQHGDVFGFRLFGRPNVFLLDADASEFVLRHHAAEFSAQEGNLDVAQALFGSSVLFADGDEHRAKRSALLPLFTRTAITAQWPTLLALLRTLTDGWAPGDNVDVHETARLFALAAVACIVLHPRIVSVADAREWLADLDELCAGLYASRCSRLDTRFRRGSMARRRLHDRLAPVLAGSPRPALVAALDGAPPDEHVDQLLTMMFAGYDTTSATAALALYEVLRDDGLRRRLCEEVRGQLQDPDALAASPLLNATITETTRLYPPVYFIPRMAVVDVVYRGFLIRKGTLVNLVPLVSQRDAATMPEPEVFRPERHVDGQVQTIAFGRGPKACIGLGLAYVEIRAWLAYLLGGFDLALAPGHPIAFRYVPSMQPADGLWVTVRGRTDTMTL